MKVEIKEVSHKGSSSLIEWVDTSGNINRSIVPSSEVIYDGNKVLVDNPDEGAPYGIDWEKLIHIKHGPKAIANLLRQYDIWTLEDYASHTATVTSVLNEACSATHQQFREAVSVRMQGRK